MTAIVRVDRNGSINHWNTAAERLFGFTKREAIGNPIEIDHSAAVACVPWAWLREVCRHRNEYVARGGYDDWPSQNGQPVRIQISVRALVDDCGSISEVEGVMFTKRRAGERKGAQAGGVLQKVSTILIHGYSLLLVRILVQKRTMSAGVNRPSLIICADTPDFPEMTECRASAWSETFAR
jgi:PAS domain S-box-containing protein